MHRLTAGPEMLDGHISHPPLFDRIRSYGHYIPLDLPRATCAHVGHLGNLPQEGPAERRSHCLPDERKDCRFYCSVYAWRPGTLKGVASAILLPTILLLIQIVVQRLFSG